LSTPEHVFGLLKSLVKKMANAYASLKHFIMQETILKCPKKDRTASAGGV